MILATDVQYDDAADTARAGGVIFAAWPDAEPITELVRLHTGLAEYVPGRFYLRELPCLLPLIESARAEHELSTIVIDGHVEVREGPGLGRHLFDALGGMIPIIGVAKSRYLGAPALEVLRGQSRQPLFVSAAGMPPEEAAEAIRQMHGDHRLPTLLRRADRLARMSG